MVHGNAADEGEGEVAFPVQAQNGKEQGEGHAMSGIILSIEDSDRELEAVLTNEKIEDDTSNVPRARTRRAVAKDKNKVIGTADWVQENIEGSKISNGKVAPGNLIRAAAVYLLTML